MNLDKRPLFIDATFFLGMHDADETRRRQSVQFFIQHMDRVLYMNLEQVGLCDDVIWARQRAEQDAYYPFMDNLHTLMDIRRIGYQAEDLLCATGEQRFAGLSLQQACTLAQVINCNGYLATHDPELRNLAQFGDWLAPVAEDHNGEFPPPLQPLYQQSVTLMLDLKGSRYV